MDDIIIFIDADVSMVENLKYIILWFEVATGLHVNITKTKVFQTNTIKNWDFICDT